MANTQLDIDRMISDILKEEIEIKSKKIAEEVGEWTEIEIEEKLHGKQHKLDKNKNGKIDAEDFKLLRKKETKEDDFDSLVDADIEDEEERDSLEQGMYEEEGETEEGNEFTRELDKARKEGKPSFKVGNKTFKTEPKEKRDDFDGRKSKVIGVYSNIDKQREMKEEKKWIQKTDMKKGALHKKLGVPEDETIPKSKLKSLKKELMKKAEGDKKLSAADSKTLKQVNLAMTLKGLKENDNSLKLTENELIEMIEKIVLEEKKNKEVKDKAEKQNISMKTPEGLKKTEKALKASKKENEDYAKEVVKKMKDYMKTGSKGEYTENPVDFPKSNFALEKDPKVKKYTPSPAVDEYIEYFSYPGQTNLVFDEIKPDVKKIEKHLKGDRMMGNAQVDEDGNALGNVVPSKVGDRFFKNFQDNVYGNEQMQASYKRYPTPVEEEGEGQTSGSLKDLKKLNKGNKVLNKLSESTESNKIIGEMEQMKKLMSYNKKTQ